MNIPIHVSAQDLALIAIVMTAAYSGGRFVIWRRGIVGSLVSASVLVLISGVLATTGEHPILIGAPLVVRCALALGLCFGLTFPCCAPPSRLRPLQAAASVAVLLHGVLDGHIVREATSAVLVALLVAHKLLDGADTRLLGGSGITRTVTRIAVIVATPLGFLFVPESSVDPTLHASLFAAVIGLNFGSAAHLVRHAAHLRREGASPA
ncbi:hypothetical protein BH11ARM2_BH11ARM2_10260 [soil metagenome]